MIAEYDFTVLDVEYLVHYRGPTPKTAANNVLIRQKATHSDGCQKLPTQQSSERRTPRFTVLVATVL